MQEIHAIGMPILTLLLLTVQPLEIYVDDESKLTLHGLQQYYIRLPEAQKNRKLNDLLDALEFNQVVIFVKSVGRASELDRLLRECNFPSITIHGGLPQEERLVHFPFVLCWRLLTIPEFHDTKVSKISISEFVWRLMSLVVELILNVSIL